MVDLKFDYYTYAKKRKKKRRRRRRKKKEEERMGGLEAKAWREVGGKKRI